MTDGVRTITDYDLTSGQTLNALISVSEILLSADNITTAADGSLSFEIEGDIEINGVINVSTDDITSTSGDVSAVFRSVMTLGQISPTAITGIVDPSINMEVSSIKLGDLPDYLSNENVKLDIKNPMSFFDIDNEAPIGVSLTGDFTSIYDENFNDVTVPFAISEVKPSLKQ